MTEQELKGLVEAVKASEVELKSALDAQGAELKSARETSAETVARIKTAEERMDSALAEFKSAREKVDLERTELAARVVELEKAAKRVGYGDAPQPEQKSIGAQFVDMLTGGSDLDRLRAGHRGSNGFQLKSLERKTTVTSGDATRLVVPQRDMMISMPQRPLRIVDLIQRVPTTVNAVEYVEVNGFGPSATSSVTGITRSSSTATVTTAAAHGLQIGDVIEIASADQSEYNGVKVVLTVPTTTTLTFAVDSGATTPATGTITWRNMSAHGAAEPVSEGSGKAEARLKFDLKTAIVQTIAHWLPATRQVLDDLPQLQALIDNELIYGANLAVERQLLYGTAVSPQLQGILTHPMAQTYAGASPMSKLEVLRRASTRVMLSEFEPNGVVVNPLDWEDIELIKGDDGHYIWAQVPGSVGAQVWRLPVVVTKSIDYGDAVVGAFNLGATYYDREQANVRFSEHHASYFTSNLLAILAEVRCAVAWKRPSAFVAVDFGTAE